MLLCFFLISNLIREFWGRSIKCTFLINSKRQRISEHLLYKNSSKGRNTIQKTPFYHMQYFVTIYRMLLLTISNKKTDYLGQMIRNAGYKGFKPYFMTSYVSKSIIEKKFAQNNVLYIMHVLFSRSTLTVPMGSSGVCP